MAWCKYSSQYAENTGEDDQLKFAEVTISNYSNTEENSQILKITAPYIIRWLEYCGPPPIQNSMSWISSLMSQAIKYFFLKNV